MRDGWRVLVFPGGTEIGLEIRKALAFCKSVELFSAGASVSSHAEFVFARHFEAPMIHEPGCLERLAGIVEAEGITHIFPAHDDVVLFLAENAGSLAAKIVTSSVEVCRVARSKSATLRRLAGVVPVPALHESPGDVGEFPVLLKPDKGQGAQGVAVARSREELDALLVQDSARLIQEYLAGPEYTVDCFSDRDRGVLYARGRRRRRIRAGIAMDSAFVEDGRFAEYARKIQDVLPFCGAWFYQAKTGAAGCLKVIEVAPRVGGTSALSRAVGVNLPLLSLYEAERVPVEIAPAPLAVEIDRSLANRYKLTFAFTTLYIDLDDTLVFRGRVNAELVKLAYQALGRGARLVLLTRHADNLGETLKRFRLHGLFDEVVHLRNGEPKAGFVTDPSGLLIDDSFAEREAVRRATGIVVADPSMAEVFLDDRA